MTVPGSASFFVFFAIAAHFFANAGSCFAYIRAANPASSESRFIVPCFGVRRGFFGAVVRGVTVFRLVRAPMTTCTALPAPRAPRAGRAS